MSLKKNKSGVSTQDLNQRGGISEQSVNDINKISLANSPELKPEAGGAKDRPKRLVKVMKKHRAQTRDWENLQSILQESRNKLSEADRDCKVEKKQKISRLSSRYNVSLMLQVGSGSIITPPSASAYNSTGTKLGHQCESVRRYRPGKPFVEARESEFYQGCRDSQVYFLPARSTPNKSAAELSTNVLFATVPVPKHRRRKLKQVKSVCLLKKIK